MNDHQYSPRQHIAGPLFLGVVAFIYNMVATKTRRPTISTGVRWIANRKQGAEIAGAAVGLLLFHWFWKQPDEG